MRSARLTHIIVTGGTGYIGAELVRQALAAGLAATLLTRNARAAPRGARHLPWQLGEALPDAALLDEHAETQAVIHLAHDWTNAAGEDGAAGLNLTGTRRLLESSRARGVGRFVFVSSQSARSDAANIYGRAKWTIEHLLDRPGEISARVGLVYGGPRQAMFGLLCRLAALPVLPMIDPWRMVQPIHLRDVARGLLLMAEQGGTGWSGLAAPHGMAFGAFLKTLAREYHGRSLPIVPVPLRMALLAAGAADAVPFGPKIDRERILGLAGTRPMACAEYLVALGLTPMPLAEGLRGEPDGRRALLGEARTLLAYVLRTPAGGALLRRYVRAVRRRGEGPLARPCALHAMPALLRACEPLSGDTPLGRRLRLASTLAEGTPEGQEVLQAGSRAARLAWLVVQGAADAAMLPLRLAIGLRRG